MGRFLTPSKITLIALITIYIEGVVPISQTVEFLNFVTSRLLPPDQESAENADLDDNASIAVFERALTIYTSAIPGRSIWDLLLKKLWAIDCSDALDRMIESLPSLLAKTREQLLRERDEGILAEPAGKIQRTSPMGAFIRRCCVEHARLQFQDSVAIWMSFVSYRLPTKAAYDRKNPNESRHALDVNLQDLRIDVSHPLSRLMFRDLAENQEAEDHTSSKYDVEKLMEFQVGELQRHGGRLPSDMKTQLDRLSEPGASGPKLGHYLKFLDSWRAGNYNSAFDSLHRYFDYTMQNRDRTFYQYALLNLAILQADFGCHHEAIPAMQEAIATARENKDVTCLNYCMSWLYHFGRAFPTQMQKIRESGIVGNEAEGLAFLKARAKDAEMWTLLSTSLLSEAKLQLQQGDSLATVFESIVKAAHVTTIKGSPNAAGPSLLMKSTVFNRLGQTHMAFSCGERFLLSHSKEAPIEDILKCTCRLASILQASGRASEAESIISAVPAHILRVLKFSNYHKTYTLMLKARRLLHHNDLHTASDILDHLRSQTPSEVETEFALIFLQIDLHVRQGNHPSALDLIEELARRLPTENNDVSIKCKLMVLKAQLWAKSSKPLKGFSLVMRAADLAYRSRAMPVLYEAVLSLCTILLSVQEWVAARAILVAILPGVLEVQDCDLNARTYGLLADSWMGLAGTVDIGSDENADGLATLSPGMAKGKSKRQSGGVSKEQVRRDEYVSSAMTMIEKSLEQWKFVEDLEGQLDMLRKKAKILHWRGDKLLANDVASQWVQLKKEYRERYIIKA